MAGYFPHESSQFPPAVNGSAVSPGAHTTSHQIGETIKSLSQYCTVQIEGLRSHLSRELQGHRDSIEQRLNEVGAADNGRRLSELASKQAIETVALRSELEASLDPLRRHLDAQTAGLTKLREEFVTKLCSETDISRDLREVAAALSATEVAVKSELEQEVSKRQDTYKDLVGQLGSLDLRLTQSEQRLEQVRLDVLDLRANAASPTWPALGPRSSSCHQFAIRLDRSDGGLPLSMSGYASGYSTPGEAARLGIDVDDSDQTTLIIEGIDGGLVGAWNDRYPDLAVKVGDKIVSVNEKTGAADVLMDECKRHQVLDVIVQRSSATGLPTVDENEAALKDGAEGDLTALRQSINDAHAILRHHTRELTEERRQRTEGLDRLEGRTSGVPTSPHPPFSRKLKTVAEIRAEVAEQLGGAAGAAFPADASTTAEAVAQAVVEDRLAARLEKSLDARIEARIGQNRAGAQASPGSNPLPGNVEETLKDLLQKVNSTLASGAGNPSQSSALAAMSTAAASPDCLEQTLKSLVRNVNQALAEREQAKGPPASSLREGPPNLSNVLAPKTTSHGVPVGFISPRGSAGSPNSNMDPSLVMQNMRSVLDGGNPDMLLAHMEAQRRPLSSTVPNYAPGSSLESPSQGLSHSSSGRVLSTGPTGALPRGSPQRESAQVTGAGPVRHMKQATQPGQGSLRLSNNAPSDPPWAGSSILAANNAGAGAGTSASRIMAPQSLRYGGNAPRMHSPTGSTTSSAVNTPTGYSRSGPQVQGMRGVLGRVPPGSLGS